MVGDPALAEGATAPDDRPSTEPTSMIDRVLAIIEVCVAHTGPIRLADLTRDTGLPKPTVRRIADGLARRGLLERAPEGYLAGARLVTYGQLALERRQASLTDVMPYVVEAHRRTGAAVSMVETGPPTDWPILANVYDRTAASSGYANTWPHQSENPAILGSAFGQVALARSRDEAEPLIRAGVPRMTPYTASHPLQLERALDRADANGEAVEHEGLVRGWSCIAVPVGQPAHGRPAGVLVLVDVSTRFSTRRFSATAHDAAAGIEQVWEPRRRHR